MFSKRGLSSVSYLLIIGCILTAFGYAIAFLFPTGTNSALSIAGLAFVLLGGSFLLVSTVWIVYRVMSSSTARIKQKRTLTAYDAMSLGVALPTWWRWWIAILPLIAILAVAQVLKIIPWYAYASIFFGYIGALILWSYIVAEKWVKSQK